MMMHEPLSHIALRGTLAHDAPLARHTTWRAGGRADRLYVPADRDDLAAFVRSLPAREPITVIGLGSNLLVRDGGVRGTVILMHNPGAMLAVQDGMIYADAGLASPKLARFAAMHGCAEAEFLAGIPGTVGGALAMNAGCYGGETWTSSSAPRCSSATAPSRCARAATSASATARSPSATARRRGASSPPRGSAFPPAMRSPPGRGSRHCSERRIATQPLSLPNAGSVFRNPPGDHAARLVESCGLKGFAIGGAQVSEQHANFIVNPGRDARAADIEALIGHVRRVVRERTGVDLEPEVRIVGEAEGAGAR